MEDKRSQKLNHRTEIKAIANKRSCNICGAEFRMQTRFDRFCGRCKAESGTFAFGDWLPVANINESHNISFKDVA